MIVNITEGKFSFFLFYLLVVDHVDEILLFRLYYLLLYLTIVIIIHGCYSLFLDAVTAMSDVGNKELKLLISDIQKCTDISTGQKLGDYALYDLVQLGPHDVGVIVRIDLDGAHILEENGKVRQIKLQGMII